MLKAATICACIIASVGAIASPLDDLAARCEPHKIAYAQGLRKPTGAPVYESEWETICRAPLEIKKRMDSDAAAAAQKN